MVIRTYSVGQLNANCYFLIKDEKCLIVDPGDDPHFLKTKLSDEQVRPRAMIATHGHFDHIMAVFDLQLTLRIPFIASKKDKEIIKNMKTSSKHFLGINSDLVPEIDQYINHGKVNLFGFKFEVIETPGHTPGSISFYFKEDSSVFVGDLMFSGGGVGRYDFSYSSRSDLKDSIEKILDLPEDTIIYPGHGGITTVEKYKKDFEKLINSNFI
ncbi:MBL fold metallo-hydrolase [Candidatus Woesebacteria bacterium]|nr:MBL fold metallo-hydrolase [Candidatus Woesebacteria bacterium]